MRNSSVAVVVLVMSLVCSREAVAQEPMPSVAPFPLDVKRTPPTFTKKEREELLKIFPMLVRASDAVVPDAAKLAGAMADLKRQDCDREDACLTQMAKLAGTLYGLYVSVDYNTDKHVIAVGRVVRDDGMAMGGAQTVELTSGGAFRDLTREALSQLMVKLGVGKLSAFRPVAPATPDVPVKEPVTMIEPPPQPPPLVVDDAGASSRSAGKALVYVGAGVAVVGAVIAGVGGSIGASAPRKGVYPSTDEAVAQLALGRTTTAVGFVGLGVGAVTAAVGAVVWGTAAPEPKTQVNVVALRDGGGMIQIGGRF